MPAPRRHPLLEVRDLRTSFPGCREDIWPVDGVSLQIGRGEALGLVGESGSGKSLTALSLVGLVPAPGRVVSGQVLLDGADLRQMRPRELQGVRGAQIGFVFQDPMTSLNPTLSVGFQVCEPLRRHLGLTKQQARARAAELLDMVGIPRARERLSDYPHEFSGGQRQRVMIAMALACEPRLVIADEPTTALDVTVQAQILELLGRLTRESRTSVLLITHDLGAAAQLCNQIAVMYAGKIVEQAPTSQIFTGPRMPYTHGLLECLPSLDDALDQAFTPIAGTPPDLGALPSGCRFSPRCPIARDICEHDQPLLRSVAPGHAVRCFAAEHGGWQ